MYVRLDFNLEHVLHDNTDMSEIVLQHTTRSVENGIIHEGESVVCFHTLLLVHKNVR